MNDEAMKNESDQFLFMNKAKIDFVKNWIEFGLKN